MIYTYIPFSVWRIDVHVHVILLLRHQLTLHQMPLGGEALQRPNGNAGPRNRRLKTETCIFGGRGVSRATTFALHSEFAQTSTFIKN